MKKKMFMFWGEKKKDNCNLRQLIPKIQDNFYNWFTDELASKMASLFMLFFYLMAYQPL